MNQNDAVAETAVVRALSPGTMEALEKELAEARYRNLQLEQECAKLRGYIEGLMEGRAGWNQQTPSWVKSPQQQTYPVWTTGSGGTAPSSWPHKTTQWPSGSVR